MQTVIFKTLSQLCIAILTYKCNNINQNPKVLSKNVVIQNVSLLSNRK